MAALPDRVLLHPEPGRREPIDPSEIYFLEAVGGGTRLRSHGSRALHDVRPLGEIEPLFLPHGFLRLHRNHLVNLRRIREIRRREEGGDWEVKLEPPVNRVLPVARSRRAELWAAFGEGRERG